MSGDRDRTDAEPARSDEELARAAKGGDEVAFDLLVRRYLRPAMSIAWQFMRSVEDAEDVVQEAFHRLVRALGGYDSRRPFSPWFYAIVRNVARTALGKHGRRAELAPLGPADEEPPAPPAGDPVVVGDVERAVEALPSMQQASFRLCAVEGFTSVEAADMLGVSDGTVRTHLHRARNRIQADMGIDKVDTGVDEVDMGIDEADTDIDEADGGYEEADLGYDDANGVGEVGSDDD